MFMKKIVLCSILAIISGGILGKITFDRYDKLNIKPVIKLDKNVYMLKYDTYKNKEDMINNTSNLEKYIYIEKDNKFYVYVAVAKTMDSINKLKNIYSDNLKVEKVNIKNDGFIQNLDEYEKLLKSTNDTDSLKVIESEILSCYEKWVVYNE